MIGAMAALAAALAWTTASGLWRSLSDQGSALQLNALKNGLATLLFLPVLALLLVLPLVRFQVMQVMAQPSGL